MITVENIENSARDALNAGLGLYRTAESKFAELRGQIEKNYSDLVARGATENAEPVVQMRRYLDEGISTVKNLQQQVEGTFKK
ncbi:MAG: hypothetical protein KDK30_07850 [Leptospiraceae bacterium]|nr:hypothetical protein [Leptospiraceae bacterium]MCB1322853.1 hypothetical protein [Leptospiraceae bacterium]